MAFGLEDQVISAADRDAIDSIKNLPNGAVPKAEDGKLVKSGQNVDVFTEEFTFDQSANFPQASANIGQLLKASEGGGFMLFSNPIADNFNFAVVDSRFNDTGSFAPRYFNMVGIQTVPIQTIDSTVITTNPLFFEITPNLQAQTNKLIFKANGPMSNVRMKISDNATGETIKHVPSRAAFENGVGGISLITGINTIDFISEDPDSPGVTNIGVTPFRLDQLSQINIEVRGNTIDLLGNALEVPFLDAVVQDAVFTDLVGIAQSGLSNLFIPVVNSDGELLDSSIKENTNSLETSKNHVIHIPNLIGTTPQTLSRVDAFVKTSVVATVTNGQFTAGDGIGPTVILDTGTPPFSAGQFVLVEGDLDNNGIREVEFNLGFLLAFRGTGGGARVEDWTLDDVVTKLATVTITKLKVSVSRTSLTGTIEHGEGDTAPITYFRLAHADDVPSIVTEEFANTNARFFSELGLPGTQGFTDTELVNGTITIVADNVLGTQQDVIKYDVPASGDTVKSEIPLVQIDWDNILTFGASYSGICKIEKDISTQSIFSGMGFSTARDPRPSSIQSRVGIFISENGTHTTITLDGQSIVILDGSSDKPLVLKDTYFSWQVKINPTPDAGVNFGTAELFANGVLVKTGGIVASNNAVNDEISVANSSSTGSTTFFFADFGVTIYEEAAVKTLSASAMLANVAQVFIPGGKRDYTIILPDGNPRKLGDRLNIIAQNIGGKLKLTTENTVVPQALFNDVNEIETDIISIDPIALINKVEGGNVYSGPFKSEEKIIYEHSGLISSGVDGGPRGMSILNATTFRLEAIKNVLVDRSLNTTFPEQRFVDLPQTDHVITGGGDQVVNTYVNKEGVYDFRSAEPTSFSVTRETFIGKAVMDAGVITVAVFTPVVAYGGTVDELAELINGGGHKTSGSILSEGGANLTLSITSGNHHQIGRGFLTDVNSPNLCDTEARAVIAFTGTTGNLFLVHADAGGNFIIDSFISNSANPDIDPVQFNSGGTLAAVPTNRFTAQRVFQACGTNDIIIYYGTETYANMADAEAGFENEDPEIKTTRDISYICTILIKETVTDLQAGVIASTVIFKNRSGDREL